MWWCGRPTCCPCSFLLKSSTTSSLRFEKHRNHRTFTFWLHQAKNFRIPKSVRVIQAGWDCQAKMHRRTHLDLCSCSVCVPACTPKMKMKMKICSKLKCGNLFVVLHVYHEFVTVKSGYLDFLRLWSCLCQLCGQRRSYELDLCLLP